MHDPAPVITLRMAAWSAEQLDTLSLTPDHTAPLIAEADFAPVSDDICVWDAWPILNRDGTRPGGDLWMALASPWFTDPEERHGHARIHLMERTADGWHTFGPAMPDGFSPGSREWSGSAILHEDCETLTLYFTAAGRRGETALSYEQRLFEATATLRAGADGWRLTGWRDLMESIRFDPAWYMSPQAGPATIGKIKAFRDPGYFLDAASGRQFLFFTGSLADSTSPFNGAIGLAHASPLAPRDWRILPPLISADRLNNELERPHVVVHDGLYYLFWSTQSHIFDPDGPVGPTGLYGMVSSDLLGDWRPLNGSGLVIANPPAAPRQAYSWLVLPDLSVTSFVDDWGHGAAHMGSRRFGGSFAPFLRLALDGATTRLIV